MVDVGALNASTMALLPKDEEGIDDGQETDVSRSLVATRPQVSNTDAKLIARIANRELASIAEEVCGEHQRGSFEDV